MSKQVSEITVSIVVGNGDSPGLNVSVAGGATGMSKAEIREYVDEQIATALENLGTWEGGSY